MVCSNCGLPIQETERVCTVCGRENVPVPDSSGGFDAALTETCPDSSMGKVDAYREPMPLEKKIQRIGILIVSLLAISAAVLFATQNPWSQNPESPVAESQADTAATDITEKRQTDVKTTASSEAATEAVPAEGATRETAPAESTATEAVPAEGATTETALAESTATEAAPAEVLTKTQKEEKAIYTSYILNTLIPEYGLAKIAPFVENFEWTGQSPVEIPPMPQENKGILSCITEDLDNDGSLELLMTNAADTSGKKGHQYQGVGIHIYALKKGTVYEIPFLWPESSCPDELTYSLDEYYQVSIIHKEENRYIFISGFRTLPDEGVKVDEFNYSFYQVTDEGAKCLDSIQICNGSIDDLLVMTDSVTQEYKEVYNAWTNLSAYKLFSKIREYFDKYGVDSSWLKPYYDDLKFYTDAYDNRTSSTAIENLVRPIAEKAQNVECITTVYGTEYLNSGLGTQRYSIKDYTDIRTELGMDSAVGKQNQPLA